MTNRRQGDRTNPEPIAVVGIGCRYPGGADSPDRFWELLRDGVDAIDEMPAGRFNIDDYVSGEANAPGKIATGQGGFLRDIDRFDADFFGISPREAMSVDPQQRLLLETAWEALEDAGQPCERVAGSLTGVFIGVWTSDYEGRSFDSTDDIDLYVTTGGGRYAASGRLSYTLDLRGPSLTVDTACSSSLVAVHLACKSLRDGESDLALAGGVNLILQPHISIGYSRSRILSPDGRCKFGDALANGYVRSEGCGVVTLKRLSDAQDDDDSIYAVILGSATNNDGQGSGLLVQPAVEGQVAMLRAAYARAGVDPAAVRYVEAHGTGTPAGDPVELEALGTVLGEGRPESRPFRVGSVKTNIGHTEAASGVAGLIKVALALKHRALPASLHFSTPSPRVPWERLPLRMQQTHGEWPSGDGPLLAGVNSFGITGTNAHLVLQEPPALPEQTDLPAAEGPMLLPLSAHSPQALADAARSLASYLEIDAPALADLCHTAGNRRTHLPERLALVGASRAAIISGLNAFARGEQFPGVHTGRAHEDRPRVVFVFPGQGSQWEGMARELLENEPAFRSALEQCDAAIYAEAGWSVISEITASPGAGRLDEIDVVQPLLFAVQVALAALWRSWGITPDAVVGHSMGEVAAAHVTGALSLEDAAAVICRRSRLLRRVRDQGAMALVELSVDEARAALAGYEEVLSIGVSNGPRSTVLSGDPSALETVLQRLQAADVFCRPVKVDVASHSPQVDPLLDDLRAALSDLTPGAGDAPIYSTVMAEPVDGLSLQADYWARNLRQPVLFGATLQRLIDDGMTAFIEISPHPILLPSIQQAIRGAGAQGLALPSLRRDEPERAMLLGSLGALYAGGAPVDWRALAPAGRHLHLPPYPWQRERFWFDEASAANGRAATRSGGHPLLGHAFTPAGSAGATNWESSLDLRRQPYLADHQVGGAVIAPATAYVEMILAAATEALGADALVIEGLEIREALVLSAEGERQVQVAVEQRGEVLEAQVFGGDAGPSADISWSLHAVAQVKRLAVTDNERAERPDQIQSRCALVATVNEHYAAMAARGLEYGPAFQSVTRTWHGENEVLGELRPIGADGSRGHSARIALFDGALQVAVASLPRSAAGAFVPVGVEELRIHSSPEPGQPLWAHAVKRRDAGDTAASFDVDVRVLAGDGCVVAVLHGIRLQSVERADLANLDGWLYQVHWHEQECSGAEGRADGDWLIVAAEPIGDAIATELLKRGGRCVLVAPGAATRRLTPSHYEFDLNTPEALATVLGEAFPADAPPRGVVYAWPLAEAEDSTSLPQIAETWAWGAISLVQALAGADWTEAPRLWLATRCAQPAGDGSVDASQAPVWGIGRVVANEHPEFKCTLIDLGPDDGAQSLCAEILAATDESQVAIRNAARYLARLEPRAPEAEPGATTRRPAALGEPYRLEVARPGILDSIGARQTTRRAAGPGEVEIRVEAAGINFVDVMKAMGICPGFEPRPDTALGGECAGVIVSVGPGVTGLAVGDVVVALTPSFRETACLASYLTVPAELVAGRPVHLSAEEAAGQLIVYMTAHYALHELGRMRTGESVLIHSATGGVGLAAMELARRSGAQIFATAGSPEKRAYLRDLGVEHVYDSRTLDFAGEILADTGGRGVDLVLNSLAGEAIEANLRALALRGRFIEIGKRDIYDNSQIGLAPFRKNLAFFALDLARMVEEDRADIADLLQTVVTLLDEREIAPLPVTTYPAAEVSEAFRAMARASHIGKLVVRLADEPVEIVTGGGLTIRRDATYLITGGLGALGLETARWLARQGARSLALMGRGGPSPSAQDAINQLEASGARVLVLRGDVTNPDDVAAALAEIDVNLPPLRGIFHAAGTLADATLLQLDRERMAAPLGPKVAGAWNLHLQTLGLPLDYFVLFSSVVAILGLPGQANYAAANAYLDSLAHQRRAAGLPALSVNWAPWAGIGLAATDEQRGARLESQGLESLEPARGLAALERLLDQDAVEVAVMRLQLDRWAGAHPAASTPFFESLREGVDVGTAAGLVDTLLDVTPDRRLLLLEEFVRDQLAQVLRLAPERLTASVPFKSLGLDSLMALELRNRLEAGSGLALSATLAWNYSTISALAEHLATRLEIPLATPAPVIDISTQVAMADELEKLSQDEVADLLRDEMDAVAKLLGTD